MAPDDIGVPTSGEARAREVFMATCRDLLQEEDYSLLAAAFDRPVMERIIAAAYKTQFDVDRYALKKEIREVKEYVISRVLQEGREIE
ncbi:hypothetical protein AB0N38_02235 [Micromonospora aurantiaca]|uniref:hypothetical protein n=1 Tax=Micromonospora TaxID=1873 RepID=UPI0024164553|nr:hypothetical protein [Micromonospora sp. WMMD718]MDG4754605.1 hypothetical protein [Micromonospora sp. WMMD718]